MQTTRRIGLALTGALVLAGTLAIGVVTASGGRTFNLALSSAAEVPTPSDEATGTAWLQINPGLHQVCFAITWDDVAGTVVASLESRILGRTTAEDVRDPSSHKVVVKKGTLLEEPQVEALVNAGVQELRIRSVLTCETTTGVCGKCYGRDLARGTPVNLGEAVGVIAAQSIGEPGTQLTMRTFHIGGAAQISEQSFVESNFDGKVKIKNKNIVKNSDGQNVAMVRNMVVAVLDPDGTERATHRIQYGARMLIEDGAQIKRGQRIAEWDPYTRPILTEVEGVIGLEDLVEGQSMSETLDESTGIAKRVVIDWPSTRSSNPIVPSTSVRIGRV